MPQLGYISKRLHQAKGPDAECILCTHSPLISLGREPAPEDFSSCLFPLLSHGVPRGDGCWPGSGWACAYRCFPTGGPFGFLPLNPGSGSLTGDTSGKTAMTGRHFKTKNTNSQRTTLFKHLRASKGKHDPLKVSNNNKYGRVQD